MPISEEHNTVQEELSGCCLDCRRSLAIVRSHILGFYDEIEARTPNSLAALSPEELYDLYRDLDDLAHLEVSRHLAEQVLEDPEIERALATIRSCYTTFFDLHELHLAEELLISEDPWTALRSFPLCPRYRSLITNQVTAMNLVPGNVLAFVGCGPLPITSILLSRLYKIRSIGLEIDSKAVSLAERCVVHLGLEQDVTIVQGDESALRGLEWDAVLVAALAEPKSRIFRNIHSILGMSDPRPVCYRTYTGMRAVLYRPVQEEDIIGFRKIREIAPVGRVNNTLVVLEPKENVPTN